MKLVANIDIDGIVTRYSDENVDRVKEDYPSNVYTNDRYPNHFYVTSIQVEMWKLKSNGCLDDPDNNTAASTSHSFSSGFRQHHYKNGELHHDTGPAYIAYNYYLYYKHGKKHRLDGPASYYFHTNMTQPTCQEYWIEGKHLSQIQFEKLRRVGSTVWSLQHAPLEWNDIGDFLEKLLNQ